SLRLTGLLLPGYPATPLARRGAAPRLEALESRYAPATLVSPTKLTYQDSDGDSVTVTFSKPVLSSGNVSTIFTFDSARSKQQFQKIRLAGVAGAAGTSITTLASRTPGGGDGFAALGEIDASGLDLGAVVIGGDLGRVLAGDATTETPGLKALTVLSLGR